MKQSLFRKLTYKKLSQVELNGNIIDLGGMRNADYHKIIKGNNTVTTVNISNDTKPDILLNLENCKLPVENDAYDAVLLINLLEHIYNYDSLIKESFRILKSGGRAVAVIPFLYYIHSSPNDYFRYTKQALEKIMQENDFIEIRVTEIGSGAFSVSYNLVHRFFPSFINLFLEKLATSIDFIIKTVAVKLKKKYSGVEYPLGYLIIAVKK